MKRLVLFVLLLLVLSSPLSGQDVPSLKSIMGTQLDIGNPLLNGLIGYWPLNEGTGTYASDLSGNMNRGMLTGGASWSMDTHGPVVELSGTSQYILLPSSAAARLDQEVTLGGWVYIDSWAVNSAQMLIMLGAGTDAEAGAFLRMGQNTILLGLGNGTSRDVAISTATGLDEGKWVFVAATGRLGGTKKAYINGVQTDSDATALTGSMRNLSLTTRYIGSWSSSNEVDGRIRVAFACNRALSPPEMASLYSDPGQLTRSNSMSWSAILSGDPPASFIPHVGLNGLINWPINGALQ